MAVPTTPSREMLEVWYARVQRAKPFLRWAGGKQYFLFQFAERIPRFSGTYIEPFLGSGAVFFKVMATQSRPAEARLGDVNKQVIQCFTAIRDDPERVCRRKTSFRRATLPRATNLSSSMSSETCTTRRCLNQIRRCSSSLTEPVGMASTA